MVIVFGCDKIYLPHLSVAICSLIENNSDTSLRIYVINSDIDIEGWGKLTALDPQKKHTFINARVEEDDLNDLVTKGQFTKAIYYRLLIENIITDDKALYIDADVVVNGSIKELWNTDITDTYLAAVEEPHYTGHELGMRPGARYFNSGVMLINLKKWRDELISDKVIEFIRQNGERLTWIDQCALNAVINGNWKRMSPKFNLQTPIFEMDLQLKESLYDFGDNDEAIKNPVIIHYTGYSKPWHLLNEHPYKNKYWQFLKKTLYNFYFPTDITPKRLLLWCLPKSIRNAIRNYSQSKKVEQ